MGYTVYIVNHTRKEYIDPQVAIGHGHKLYEFCAEPRFGVLMAFILTYDEGGEMHWGGGEYSTENDDTMMGCWARDSVQLTGEINGEFDDEEYTDISEKLKPHLEFQFRNLRENGFQI